MRRFLLISLSLVLALVGWSAVGAEDGFYVIPSMKVVPKTGQTVTSGTRDDGYLKRGVAWPTPRFTDNLNGTVTDNLTKLIWMKNANYFGGFMWPSALSSANGLHSGMAGLTDGSQAGDWRLPNLRELQSLVHYGRHDPALPAGHPFTNVRAGTYLSSTAWAHPTITSGVWIVSFTDGTRYYLSKNSLNHVWCVRGGP